MCLRVSKHWKEVLISCPSLWTILNLSGVQFGAKRRNLKSSMKAYAKLAQGKVQTVSLNHIAMQATHFLRAFLKKNRTLKNLIVYTGGEVGEALVRGLQRAPDLTSLILGDRVLVDEMTIRMVAQCCPNLITLEVKHLKRCPQGGLVKGAALTQLKNLVVCFDDTPADIFDLVRARIAIDHQTERSKARWII